MGSWERFARSLMGLCIWQRGMRGEVNIIIDNLLKINDDRVFNRLFFQIQVNRLLRILKRYITTHLRFYSLGHLPVKMLTIPFSKSISRKDSTQCTNNWILIRWKVSSDSGILSRILMVVWMCLSTMRRLLIRLFWYILTNCWMFEIVNLINYKLFR